MIPGKRGRIKRGEKNKKKCMMRRVRNNSRRKRTGRGWIIKQNKVPGGEFEPKGENKEGYGRRRIRKDVEDDSNQESLVQSSSCLLTFGLVSLVYHSHHRYHTIVLVKIYHHPRHVMYSYWHILLI